MPWFLRSLAACADPEVAEEIEAGPPYDFPDAPTDGDGDGWIDAQDCDPEDPAVHSGAEELCNGEDEDCDGLVDDGLPWGERYADADGDGWGTGESFTTCDVTGAADVAGDCDDTDGSVYPGAEEYLCLDGVDQDCDGADVERECGDTEVRRATTVDLGLFGEQDFDYVGGAMAMTGDLDGDGVDDLWIFGGDRVVLVSGAARGDLALGDAAVAEIVGVGSTLAASDDLDGDGVPDLVARGSSVYVFHGVPVGELQRWDADGELTDDGEGYFTGALATSPDLTGDGLADVVVGAGGEDGGEARIFAGPFAGERAIADATVTIAGDDPDDETGRTVAGVGDVNGDGAADLAVGAPYAAMEGIARGRVGIFYGPIAADLAIADADRSVIGDRDVYLGLVTPAHGDGDGDGIEDLLFGSPIEEAYYWAGSGGTRHEGAAYLVAGGTAERGEMTVYGAAAKFVCDCTASGSTLGTDVDVGDVDGDGTADLLVTQRGYYDWTGDAWGWYGPVSGTYGLEHASVHFEGEYWTDDFGSALSVGGDRDGDGGADVVVGAIGVDDGGLLAGAAYVFF